MRLSLPRESVTAVRLLQEASHELVRTFKKRMLQDIIDRPVMRYLGICRSRKERVRRLSP